MYVKVAAAALMLLAAPALAQTSTTTTTTTPMPAPGTAMGPMTPANFVALAGASGLFEVESSRLALDQSRHDQVRTFAQHMVTDHTQANQQLAALARQQGIAVPATPSPSQQGMMDQMKSLTGSDFDRQYMQAQVLGHQETVQLYDAASRSTTQGMEPFRAFAAEKLPILQQHLQMAQSIAGTGTPTAKQ